MPTDSQVSQPTDPSQPLTRARSHLFPAGQLVPFILVTVLFFLWGIPNNINDVLIRIHRTGICGTDLHIYNWNDWAQRTIPVPPDPATLRAIAETTGGKFYEAQNAGSLHSAYSKLGSSLGRAPGKTEVTYAFLAGAAGLLVAAGFLSALWSPRLP